ncbi:biotin-dependent carboxyltransferase family protein [Dokdonella koreensis]|uniref:Allophanate hydrolase 2 subunit 2 n=1 Tax=Dokdonella koreensis DS-123 TaxID=1300342 RepID=A0A160DVC1_9GAMM|nr:biotin-dependent carboxyltransferase family protein [Dokdonella koreensis]ANB18469.1 Allophanate hydrolase 2 subunit 2 [Dokdonella koreensis DS-123]
MSITVLRPGLLTTVQDSGRTGHAGAGVGRSGPLDDVAARLANALVGNAATAALLEITLAGPRLRFAAAATLALTGGAVDARLDDRPAATWRPLAVAAGEVLDLGAVRLGARAYLAVAGGLAVERVLGSAATDLNAGLGPFGGRALAAGDVLALGDARPLRIDPRWSLDPQPWFDPRSGQPIRLVRGRHWDALTDAAQTALLAAEWRIAAASNRVGFRLDGPPLALRAPLELVSEPVAPGTLQLPPGGQPIALMAEHPTTGGYPRAGQVAGVDIARLAQLRPGDRLHLQEIAIDEAQARYLWRERQLAALIAAIGERLRT